MRQFAILTFAMLLLTLGCGSRDAMTSNASSATKNGTRYGLSDIGDSTVDRIILLDDRAEFDAAVEAVAVSGKENTFVILTHVMFELPWNPDLAPKGRSDLRMRKCALENRLDRLGHPDGLSARYFRAAIKGRGSIEDTKKRLLDWYLESQYRQEWLPDRGYFRFNPTERHPQGTSGH